MRLIKKASVFRYSRDIELIQENQQGGVEKKIAPFSAKEVPWIENGYFLLDDFRASRHPYYFAGLAYLQEPSAMTPANRLNVEPGDFVLDLCAAPGGKATELGSRLKEKGMLVANDISNSRAKALLKKKSGTGRNSQSLCNK